MTKINIRAAKESDSHAIATVHVKSWQKIYRGHIPDTILDKLSIYEREQKWLELIRNQVKILVIEKDSLIVGFASLCSTRDTDDHERCGEISAIYTLIPPYGIKDLARNYVIKHSPS